MGFKDWLKLMEVSDTERLSVVRKDRWPKGEYQGKPPAVAIGYMKKRMVK